MNYTDLVTDIQNYSEQLAPNTSDEFAAAVPVFIQNAEHRIYRECDFLATRQQTAFIVLTPGQRTVSLSTVPFPNQPLLTDTLQPLLTDTGVPLLTTNTLVVTNAAYPVVVQSLAAIVLGRRVRYRPASLDWIDSVWPNEAITAVPTYDNAYFTMLSDAIAVVCPTPDAPYQAELTGTWRPMPISVDNSETWLSKFNPDLLFIACMVEATGWAQNFGAQSDNPQMALSWSKRYEEAKASVMEVEQRRKSQWPGWQPLSPTPLAQPPR